MKKLFFIICVLFLSSTHLVHASETTKTITGSYGIVSTIKTVTTATTANLTVTIANPSTIPIESTLKVYKTILPNLQCTDLISTYPVTLGDDDASFNKTYEITQLLPNKDYCYYYTGFPSPIIFKTEVGTAQTVPYQWPLASAGATGQSVTVGGRVDVTKFTGTLSDLAIELQISSTPFSTTQPPSTIVGGQTKYQAQNTPLEAGGLGIKTDGSYFFYIGGLTPGETLYCRQIIQNRGTGAVIDVNADNCVINSSNGIVPQGSALAQSLEDQKSYHLLAPWPKLTVLYDPDLCQQKKLEGALPPNSICDVNGFLDFAFKTLIGLTALVLVLRLMYEGYQYVVTDVPFLKANAKSGFFTALGGLVLALSAYVILNTINPKLVSNSFNISGINLGVDDETETSPDSIYYTSGNISTCPEGFTDVQTYGNPSKINICKSISAKLTALISAAKQNNVILTGYGSRSTERQKQLRVAHGCPNDNAPSSSCHPPTARPGRSMHERGLAVDFSCNGTSITSRTNSCYVWLAAHAAEYGFKNLHSEPWHWSINGK